MATFNGRPIDGELRTMRFRTGIDDRDSAFKTFLKNHPNIDILSITTAFYSITYAVTTIWYTEGNNAK